MTTDILERTNGHQQKGRTVPPLPQFTFKDSGITVQFYRIGPMTRQQISLQVQRDIPKPPPPIVQTEIGPEENEADPDYEKQLRAWEAACTQELNLRLLKIAALNTVCDVDTAAVARVKRNLAAAKTPWEDDTALADEDNDRICYILHVAIATQEDLEEFGTAILTRSQPTEAAVQAHIDSFPGVTQGTGRVPVPAGTEIGDDV